MGLGCGWNGGDGNDEKRFICVIASFAICDLGGFYHLVERLVVSADLGIRLANVDEMDAVEMKEVRTLEPWEEKENRYVRKIKKKVQEMETKATA